MNELLFVLLSMVVMVPISKRLGLGAVLGYLIAGVIIGPNVLGVFGNTSTAAHISELGVTMMLLLIGLELSPRLLWQMRGPILGLGSAQVILTAAAFSGIAISLGHSWPTAVTIGLILSCSSTAIVLPTLQERGYSKSLAGERAFAVLLFQDLAVIPILAILPFLKSQMGSLDSSAAVKGNPLQSLALLVGAITFLVVMGRFIIGHLFRFIARTKLRESFTALALLIVIASSTITQAAGLSPALGAFIAGVVLASSEFRHQIQVDIEPFKGLFLGLFFISVGSTIDLKMIASNPQLVAMMLIGLLTIKTFILLGLGKLHRIPRPENILLSASLSQAGEFGFVILAQSSGLIDSATSQVLISTIALSMALTPLIIVGIIKFVMSRMYCLLKDSPSAAPRSVPVEIKQDGPILVLGIGRFGQTLTRFLKSSGYQSTVLDLDSEQISIMAKFGIRAYFGDGANMDLLRAAGIENAMALAIAIDDPATTLKIVEQVKLEYPGLPIFARAFDRIHAYKLLHMGVDQIAIETSGSAIHLGQELLQKIGVHPSTIFRKSQLFKKLNDQSIRFLASRYHETDREQFIGQSREISEQLESLLSTDQASGHHSTISGWDSFQSARTRLEKKPSELPENSL